jgi:hypothetical protein
LSWVVEEGSGLLDLVPNADVPAGANPTMEWFDDVTFAGAFDPASDCTWLEGWSMLSNRGFIGCSTNIAQAEASAFAVFPNPTNGQFTITSDWNASHATIQVVDLNGKRVFQSIETLSAGQQLPVDLTHVDAGLYIVTVSDGIRTHYSRLIIE